LEDYDYRKEIVKEKHTHKRKKNTRCITDQAQKRHKHRTATSSSTSNAINQLLTKTGLLTSNEANAYIISGINEIYI